MAGRGGDLRNNWDEGIWKVRVQALEFELEERAVTMSELRALVAELHEQLTRANRAAVRMAQRLQRGASLRQVA